MKIFSHLKERHSNSSILSNIWYMLNGWFWNNPKAFRLHFIVYVIQLITLLNTKIGTAFKVIRHLSVSSMTVGHVIPKPWALICITVSLTHTGTLVTWISYQTTTFDLWLYAGGHCHRKGLTAVRKCDKWSCMWNYM